MTVANEPVPVLLLKTKSGAGDAYEELFAEPQKGAKFEPIFVPVLEHRFEDQGMRKVQGILGNREIAREPQSSYGGLIFTSQRAVEAFAKLVNEGGKDLGE
jgi:uroporphyrinogen-III synthase